MNRTRSTVTSVVVALLAVIAAACGSDAPPQSQDAAGDVERATPTSGPIAEPGDPTPPRDPDAPREVPPFVLPAEAPGTDEAYQAMVDDLDRFITDEQRSAGVPWPDLRNPDPIKAYQSAAEFQNWMSENNPTPSLVEAYTAPNSPERGFDLDLFALYAASNLLSTPSQPPYSMRVEHLVHPAATQITDGLLAQVPEGSAAVVYWDSVGVSQLVNPDGEVFSTSEGWNDLGPWVAIMAPTDVGWQVWWDELTEPPPPGEEFDRGQPSEDRPRPEV